MSRKTNPLSLIILSATLAMAIGGPAQAQTAKTDVVTLRLADGTPAGGDVVGEARLRRSLQGAKLSVDTTGLSPGAAYTVWWIIFNNPEACAPGGCSAADFGNPAVEASVVNATGRVADSDGNATFGSFLPAGFMHTNPPSGNIRQPFGPALQDVRGAEIHAIVRCHGPSTGNMEQISTLFGDCLADDGMGNLVCFDAQVAVFPLSHHDDD